jgi:aconitate hydratase
VAKSIERIHLANLINFGIVPFIFDRAADYEEIRQGDELTVAGLRKAVEGDGKAVLRVKRGEDVLSIPVRAKLSEREKEIVLAGGLLATVGKK